MEVTVTSEGSYSDVTDVDYGRQPGGHIEPVLTFTDGSHEFFTGFHGVEVVEQ